MILRPYQQASIDCLWRYVQAMPGNPCVVLPTGAGKSPTMAAVARQAVEQWGARVLVLAHVKELVEQNADKMRSIWPEADIGIYSAGLKRKDRYNRIIFGSVQSVVRDPHALGKFDLVLVDEAHHIPLQGDGMYRTVIEALRVHEPQLRVYGFTATPYRLGAGPVCGPDNLLTDIVYEISVSQLIGDGYLCNLVSQTHDTPDLDSVHMRGGEFVEAELAAVMTEESRVTRTVETLCELAAERRAWIVFCVNVKHAEMVTQELRDRGVPTGLVTGATPMFQRDQTIAEFQSRQLRALVNVNVLSEGFDATHVDCVAMLRPTLSPGLYYQQVGRGLRLHPDKRDCLVLDFAGNILRHGPVDAIIPPNQPGEGGGEAPWKRCPACKIVVHASVLQCPGCGHEFPPPVRVSHDVRPSGGSILTTETRDTWLTVNDVRYAYHMTKKDIPALRVTYECGVRSISEYVCLEHSGYAQERAHLWWSLRHSAPPPKTIDDALPLAHDIVAPVKILTRLDGKFLKVIGYDFTHPSGKGPDDSVATESARLSEIATGEPGLRGLRRVLAELRPLRNMEDSGAGRSATGGL